MTGETNKRYKHGVPKDPDWVEGPLGPRISIIARTVKTWTPEQLEANIATEVAGSVTVAGVVSNQPESLKEALDVVAFGAAFKSVSALTNKSECFLIMLIIHSLWSPSMMTAFAKLLINSQDISATGALILFSRLGNLPFEVR